MASLDRFPDSELLKMLVHLEPHDYDGAVLSLKAIRAFTIRIVAYEWDSAEAFGNAVEGKSWATKLWQDCSVLARRAAEVARGGMHAFSECEDGRKQLSPYVRCCFMFLILVLSQMKPRTVYLGPLQQACTICYSDAAWEYDQAGSKVVATMGSLLNPRSSNLFVGRAAVISSDWLSYLVPRDSQIMPCELLALLCAIYSDVEKFRDSASILFIDSLAGASALVKGYSHEPDIQWLVTCIHAMLFKLNCKWWVEWLPSESNPSDALSRFAQQDFVETVKELRIPTSAYPLEDFSKLFAALDKDL